MKANLSESVGIGDNVILVSIGEEDEIVKITGQTKRYFEIDLTTVKEDHHTRLDFDCEREPETIILKTAKFVKTSGYIKGSDNYLGRRYCAEYITTPSQRIEALRGCIEYFPEEKASYEKQIAKYEKL